VGRFRIAILICAYNEKKTVRKVIKQVKRLGEVFLIDDGSTDGTFSEIKDLKINYYKNKENIGYENSIFRGFRIISNKKFDFLATMDADGQHTSTSIKKLLSQINKYDIVIGSRKKKNNISENLLSFFTKKYLNLNDILCGLKAYRLKKFEKYTPNNSNLIGTNYLFYAIKKNLKIKEVKINSKLRKYGNSKFYSKITNYLKIFQVILKILKTGKKNDS